jgi:DNA-3-methyladenine glycosylase II
MPAPTLNGVNRRTAPPAFWTPEFIAAATQELRGFDPILGRAIDAIGPCPLRPESNYFSLLVRTIISQQISVKAARSIARRLRRSLPGARFTPAALSRLPIDGYRAVGLSGARAACVRNLAEAVAGRRLSLTRLAAAPDDEIVGALTALPGIGRWTAEMLLLFGYGRPDIFPESDLGIRKAVADLYGHADLPPPLVCRAAAEAWRPHRSLAAWYLWRHADRTGATLGLRRYPV